MLKSLVRPVESSGRYLLQWRQHLQSALVYSRPSSAVRSPYLADVRLTGDSSMQRGNNHCDNEGGSHEGVAIAHAPSLGCGGLVEEGKPVHVAKLQESKSGANAARHSTHRIVTATDTTPDKCVVGVDPLLPNQIANSLLLRFGCQLGTALSQPTAEISPLLQRHQAEVAMHDSRFDFVSTFLHRNVPSAVVTEVKSVPLTNVSLTRRRTSASNAPVGLFPFVPKYNEGKAQQKRKNLSRAEAQRRFKASSRLCKHLLELARMRLHGPTTVLTSVGPHTVVGRQVLLVATRPDVSSIVLTTQSNPSLTDAVAAALTAGVRLVGCSTSWDSHGVQFKRWLPVLTDGVCQHSLLAGAMGVAAAPASAGRAGQHALSIPEPWRVSETHQVAEAKRLQIAGGTSASLGMSEFNNAVHDSGLGDPLPATSPRAGSGWPARHPHTQPKQADQAEVNSATERGVLLEGEAELQERLRGLQLLSAESAALFARDSFQGPRPAAPSVYGATRQ